MSSLEHGRWLLFCWGPSSDVPENIDYDFAQQELMLQQMEDDPIQVAIRSIEKQHEEDKQGKASTVWRCVLTVINWRRWKTRK